MADYTFSTTTEQEAAIDLHHKLRAPEKTRDQFVSESIGAELSAIAKAFIEARVQKLVDAYRAGTPEQRAQVDAILKLSLVPDAEVVRG